MEGVAGYMEGNRGGALRKQAGRRNGVRAIFSIS